MTLLRTEGFDDGLAAARTGATLGTVSASYGHGGTNGMRVGDGPAMRFVEDVSALTSDTTITAGSWVQVKTDGLTTDGRYFINGFVSFDGSMQSYYHVVVMANPTTRAWAVLDRTGYTDGVASAFQVDTWYYVELQATIHDTTGSWELMVDGVSVLSASSRDTRNGTDTLFWVAGGWATYDVEDMWIDDIYVLDSTGSLNNDFLGICKVETLLPDGNGTSSDMVGSDGNSTDNHLLVDNNTTIPPATTEYVGAAVEGDQDTYAMDDLSGTATVHGVVTTLYSTKTDTGAKFLRPVIRSGTTDYAGTSAALSTDTYVPIDEIWETDPDTATVWLYGGVNAMEVGQEVRDS